MIRNHWQCLSIRLVRTSFILLHLSLKVSDLCFNCSLYEQFCLIYRSLWFFSSYIASVGFFISVSADAWTQSDLLWNFTTVHGPQVIFSTTSQLFFPFISWNIRPFTVSLSVFSRHSCCFLRRDLPCCIMLHADGLLFLHCSECSLVYKG